MAARKEQETEIVQSEAVESITLISPGGYKYEISVTDSGNLDIQFKRGENDENQ